MSPLALPFKVTKRTAMAVLASLSFVVIHDARAHVPLHQASSGNVLLGSINVNTASEGELRRIPGLLRRDVARILAERQAAPLRAPEDLDFLTSAVALRYLHFDGPSDLRLIRQPLALAPLAAAR